MLELFQAYCNAKDTAYLVQLINHPYILKIINYHINSNDLFELTDVQNILFIKLVERADRLSFDREEKFKSYLSMTTKGLVLNERRNSKQSLRSNYEEALEEETYEDNYDYQQLPLYTRKKIDTYLDEHPSFKEFVLEEKTTKELAKKYKVTSKTITNWNVTCRNELRDYLNFTENRTDVYIER